MHLKFVVGLLLLVGCKPNGDKSQAIRNSSECVPYFQYDNIEHFSMQIEADSIWNIFDKQNQTEKEKTLIEIVTAETIDEIADTLKLSDLISLGYKKKDLPNDKFNAVNDLFCERNYDEISVNMCIPVYRDILLFKREKQTIGYARICFECEMSSIVGSTRDTKTFGQAGEFQKLNRLLH